MAISQGPWNHGQGPAPGIGKAALRSGQEFMPNTVIGHGCRLNGKFELVGRVHVDGVLEGEVFVQGELTIGEQGQVRAKIRADQVRILGQVLGDIDCNERLEMCAGARVVGDIKSPAVAIQDGVVFEGRCTMPRPNDDQTDDEAHAGKKQQDEQAEGDVVLNG